MNICSHCKQQIYGASVVHNPPVLQIMLGIDSLKFYHPSCYREDAEELSLEEQDNYATKKGTK